MLNVCQHFSLQHLFYFCHFGNSILINQTKKIKNLHDQVYSNIKH